MGASAHASTGSARTDLVDWNTPHATRFKAAMDDDFNTPEAVAVLFDLANEVNRSQSVEAATHLVTLAGVLGLLQRDPQDFLQGRASMNLTVPTPTLEASGGALDIDALIEARIAAKKSKNFAEADRIRKELLEAGIVLEDYGAGYDLAQSLR